MKQDVRPNEISNRANRCRRPFFGWFLLAAVWVIYLLNVAMPLYGGSVINSIMLLDTGISQENMGLAATAHTIFYGLGSFLAGIAVKKWGYRATYICGSVLVIGAALASLLLPPSGWTLILSYGVLVALGISIGGALCTQSLVIQWFEKNQSVAMAIALTAGAAGGAITPPVVSAVAKAAGWRVSWIVVAAGAVGAILLAVFFVKNSPEEIGEVRDGHAAHDARTGARQASETPSERMPYSMTLRQALGSRTYYVLILLETMHNAIYYSVLSYVVIYAVSCGIPTALAALAVSAISIASFVGRLVSGALGRIGVPWKVILAASATLSCVSGVLLFFGGTLPVFLAAGACLGFAFGLLLVASPIAYSYYFGPENFGIIFGLGTMIFMAAGSFGPTMVGMLGASLGSYAVPFLALGLANVACAFLSMTMKVSKLRYGGGAA